jgi:hypothetical protein
MRYYYEMRYLFRNNFVRPLIQFIQQDKPLKLTEYSMKLSFKSPIMHERTVASFKPS